MEAYATHAWALYERMVATLTQIQEGRYAQHSEEICVQMLAPDTHEGEGGNRYHVDFFGKAPLDEKHLRIHAKNLHAVAMLFAALQLMEKEAEGGKMNR